MFKKKTLFVLGAGASWHYGYPTGEELVVEVQALAKRLRIHCQMRLQSRLNLGQMPAFMGGVPNELLPVLKTPSLVFLWNREVCHGETEVHARVQA